MMKESCWSIFLGWNTVSRLSYAKFIEERDGCVVAASVADFK